MTVELVGGPWCGKLAEVPRAVDEWHLPAPAFEPTGNPEMDRMPYVDAKLVYRRRGDSAKFDYVDVLAQ